MQATEPDAMSGLEASLATWSDGEIDRARKEVSERWVSWCDASPSWSRTVYQVTRGVGIQEADSARCRIQLVARDGIGLYVCTDNTQLTDFLYHQTYDISQNHT